MENNKHFELSIDVINTRHRKEDNTTYCDMSFKINLNEFERMTHTFNESFIKNEISEFLPIVKTIYNYSYSDTNPVIAKFYILPSGTAKVLEFNTQYYKKYRKFDNEHLLSVDQIIPVKQILNAVNKYGEMNVYNYCPTFKVTGKAVCAPEDVYDSKIGEVLSEEKAMIKASTRINKLFKVIAKKTLNMYGTLEGAISHTDEYNTRITNLINDTNKLSQENNPEK